jgi:N-acetylmuramoyl-L-alanine amidase
MQFKLAKQLIRAMECHANVAFAPIAEVAGKLSFDPAVKAVPFLQASAAKGLKCMADKQTLNAPLQLNSAQRTLVQQLFLYRKYTNKLCEIPLAAEPCTRYHSLKFVHAPSNRATILCSDKSNHLSGAAVDIQQGRQFYLTGVPKTCGWTYMGRSDPVHFDYVDSKDIRKTAVWAFQRLWNRCKPADSAALVEDGNWGPATENALMKSPANGFADCQICPNDPKPEPKTTAPVSPTTDPASSGGSGTKPKPQVGPKVAAKPGAKAGAKIQAATKKPAAATKKAAAY